MPTRRPPWRTARRAARSTRVAQRRGVEVNHDRLDAHDVSEASPAKSGRRPIDAQRVQHDEQRARRHAEAGRPRREPAEQRERNAGRVVGDRPGEVLAHDAHRPLRDARAPGDVGERAREQDEVGLRAGQRRPSPIANETSARAITGASLRPSPTMATRRPGLQRRDAASLSAGWRRPRRASMPSVGGEGRDARRGVARQQRDVEAGAAQRLDVSRASSARSTSAKRNSASRRAGRRTPARRRARAGERRQRRPGGRVGDGAAAARRPPDAGGARAR